jgi:hypothetical protein
MTTKQPADDYGRPPVPTEASPVHVWTDSMGHIHHLTHWTALESEGRHYGCEMENGRGPTKTIPCWTHSCQHCGKGRTDFQHEDRHGPLRFVRCV